MSRPVQATVDLHALRQNLQVVRRAAPHCRVWSVVKANAYGHGIDRIWRALEGTDGFALLNLEEAILLRERGWKGPILMLEGFFHADELPLFDKYRLTTSVHSNWQIKALQDARLHAPLDVYLKMNSGMNRLGFQPERVQTLWRQLRELSNVGDITLMAHFADAEKPDGIAGAMIRINHASEGLDCPRSLSNSAATLWHPEAHGDWVRPGLMLYGATPFEQDHPLAARLQPVMTVESKVICVRELPAGEPVGYGAKFITPKPMRIGVVAMGYADGYPRHAPTGTPVLVAGQRSQLLGRVSMDMLCIDLTDVPDAGLGSTVELWGKNILASELAEKAETIPYQIFCNLKRVPRLYSGS
ncbi:MAG: alanine racemase [Pseudomonas sp.]|nr:alanine racemase [Pseudomonas sp.]